ncbi:MAG: hypothetical protein II453_10230 [Alphaproteobacteria bacterium]|nr:hypothetical protein [Alphaproteobacteria bacterium]
MTVNSIISKMKPYEGGKVSLIAEGDKNKLSIVFTKDGCPYLFDLMWDNDIKFFRALTPLFNYFDEMIIVPEGTALACIIADSIIDSGKNN